MLSIGAFNALLKPLEEPPSYVIFILATTEVHKIPITILSRCQRYDFKRIGIDTISGRLRELVDIEQMNVEEKALKYVAKVADGSMRDALSLLDQCVAFNYGEVLTYDKALDILGAVDTSVFSKLLRLVLEDDIIGCVELLEDIVMQGRELGQFVTDFTWYLRNLMLVKSCDDDFAEDVLDISSEHMKLLREEAMMLEGYEVKDQGIFSTDKEVVKKQGGLIKEVIAQLIKSISKGTGSMSLSLPVRIFEPRTMLERITDWWAYAPLLLKQASELTDPIEVMKKVICFALSGLFRSTQQLKPFNPMLGETYQGHWEDGTKIYLEHTSHIPPISNFLIIGKDNSYRLSGYFDMALDGILKSMMSNSMGMIPKGKCTVHFTKTGQTIDFQLPKVSIGGMLYGDRFVVFNGLAKFEDRKNNVKTVVCFNKSRKELKSKRVHDIYGRIFKWDYAKNNDKPIIGEKYYENSVPAHPFPLKNVGIIHEITGSWIEDIKFDKKSYYSIKDTPAPQIYPDEVVLDSDSRYREDKKWMTYAWEFPEYASLYMDYCQGWKWALEAQQRLERGIRKEGNDRRLGIFDPNAVTPTKEVKKDATANNSKVENPQPQTNAPVAENPQQESAPPKETVPQTSVPPQETVPQSTDAAEEKK